MNYFVFGCLGLGFFIRVTFADPTDAVNQPLPHSYFGCPFIHYWGGSCVGIYPAVDDLLWKNEAQPKIITWHDNKYYKCCAPAWYTYGKCGSVVHHDAGSEDGPQQATCIYADNYCPKLKVTEANDAACLGEFTQTNNATWYDSGKALTVAGRYPDGSLKFECKEANASLGYVTKHECISSYPKLTYGLNRLHDGSRLFVPREEDVVGAPEFRAFRMTTGSISSDAVTVWNRSPTAWRPLIFTTLSANDPRMAYVVVEDVGLATFSIRVVGPAKCATHRRETINILMANKGVHVSKDGQKMLIDSKTVMGGPPQRFSVGQRQPFPELPIVLAHVWEVTHGPPDGFLHVRVAGKSRTSVDLVLETNSSGDCPSNYNAAVGVLAMYTGGYRHGLVEGVYYHSINEGQDFSTLTTRPHVDQLQSSVTDDTASPLVFAGQFGYNSPRGGSVRLVSSSVRHAELQYVASCDGNAGEDRYSEAYNAIAITGAPIFEEEKQDFVALPLYSKHYGCPFMEYWGGTCRGIYRHIDDPGWLSHDKTKLVAWVYGAYYKCCSADNYAYQQCNGDMIHDAGNSTDGVLQATCIYNDNWCPALSVLDADSQNCIGDFLQKDDTHWERGSILLTFVGRLNGRMKLACSDPTLRAAALGFVRKYECQRPYKHLRYGLNTLHDGSLLYVPSVSDIGPSSFRTFQMTTGSTPSQWIGVWITDITFHANYIFTTVTANNRQPLYAELKDLMHVTFGIRLVAGEDCQPKEKEKINVIMAGGNQYVTNDGQKLVIWGETVSSGAPQSFTYYGDSQVEFPGKPFVLSQLRTITNGPPDGFMHVRVSSKTTTAVQLVLETAAAGALVPAGYTAHASVLAIYTGGKLTGLLGDGRSYSVVGEGADALSVAGGLSVAKLPSIGGEPLIFAASFSYNSVEPGAIQIAAATTDYSAVTFVGGTCQKPSNADRAAEDGGFMILSFAKPKVKTVPQDCILRIGGKHNEICIFNGDIDEGGTGVWQAVDSDGNFKDIKITNSGDWIWKVNLPGEPDRLFARGTNEDIVCPVDGLELEGVRGDVKTFLYRAAPSDITCRPVDASVIGFERRIDISSLKAKGLMDCARVAISLHPDALAVSFVGETAEAPNCFAMFGGKPVLNTDPQANSNGTVSCVLGCQKLPGRAKPANAAAGTKGVLIGTLASFDDCVDSAVQGHPGANGVTFGKSPGRSAGQCFAEYDMSGVEASAGDRLEWECSFVGPWRKATITTTTTTTTTTTATTTTTITTTSTAATTVGAIAPMVTGTITSTNTETAGGSAATRKSAAVKKDGGGMASGNKTGIIVGASVGGAALVAGAAAFCCRRLREDPEEEEPDFEDHEVESFY